MVETVSDFEFPTSVAVNVCDDVNSAHDPETVVDASGGVTEVVVVAVCSTEVNSNVFVSTVDGDFDSETEIEIDGVIVEEADIACVLEMGRLRLYVAEGLREALLGDDDALRPEEAERDAL